MEVSPGIARGWCSGNMHTTFLGFFAVVTEKLGDVVGEFRADGQSEEEFS